MWTAEVPANTPAKAFAVTIEPVGGAPQPTGPKVLLGAA
jgi:anti-sigma-K factor RskA